MRINAKNFIGSLIIVLFLSAASVMVVKSFAVAQEIPPELVMVHIAAIDAAQRSNAIQLPEKLRLEKELATTNSVVNASNDTARTSREIICSQYSSWCTEANLNPQGAEVDLSHYINGTFQ